LAWVPERGYRANADTVKSVYRYYGQLYRDHPYLEWAGMANLVGATFLAGMQDAAAINAHLATPRRVIGRLPAPVRDAFRGVSNLVGLSGLGRVETRLLSMQQQIFFDQAMMHEAYLGGGLQAIEGLRTAGLIDDRAVTSWQQIDLGRRTGRADQVHAGTRGLVWREQMQIIDDDYDQMRADGLGGPALTYLLTGVGTISVPGARRPLDFRNISLGPIKLLTMDISRREHRWRLIDQDLVPAYNRLLDVDRATMSRLVATDVEQRIRDLKRVIRWQAPAALGGPVAR
jgi:hypothetical protein